MTGVCPYCGADMDCATAAPGATPGTVLCPHCGQERDYPAGLGSAPTPEPGAAGPTPAADPPPSPSATPDPPLSPPPPPLPTCDGLAGLGEPLGEAPPEPEYTPAWEAEGGLLSRLWHTTMQMMLHPVKSLSGPARPGLSWSLSYGLIVGSLGTAGQVFWTQALGGGHASTLAAVLQLIFTPLLILVGLFLGAGLVHFMLFIVGGAKQGFRATFRALAYSYAPSVWYLVPVVGLWLGGVWAVVVMVASLATSHGVGKGRVVFALIFPLIFLGLMFSGFILLFGLGFLAGGGAGR